VARWPDGRHDLLFIRLTAERNSWDLHTSPLVTFMEGTAMVTYCGHLVAGYRKICRRIWYEWRCARKNLV